MLDRQIGGLGAAQDAVGEDGGAPVDGAEDRGVGEQKARIGIERDLAGRRQAARDRRFGDALPEIVDDRIGDDEERVDALAAEPIDFGSTSSASSTRPRLAFMSMAAAVFCPISAISCVTGFERVLTKPTCPIAGTASFSNWTCFGMVSSLASVSPVTLPPGRA